MVEIRLLFGRRLFFILVKCPLRSQKITIWQSEVVIVHVNVLRRIVMYAVGVIDMWILRCRSGIILSHFAIGFNRTLFDLFGHRLD